MEAGKNRNVEKLNELMGNSTMCMFITNTENLSGRPMRINEIDEDGTMWFFAKVLSNKVYEIVENKKISLVVVNENDNTYLMVNGTAKISYDEMKMNKLWNPEMKIWFPEGMDDPDMVLIKVSPLEASYWDNNGTRMVMLFSPHSKQLMPVINMMDVSTANNYRYKVS